MSDESPPREMLPWSELKERYPTLSKGAIGGLATRGIVRAEPVPGRPRLRRYDALDVGRYLGAFADGQPVDHFDDDQGSWVWVRKLGPEKLVKQCLRLKDCPKLKGGALRVRQVKFRGLGEPRSYVLREQFGAAVAWLSRDTSDYTDGDVWLEYSAALDLGFNPTFLFKFSDAVGRRKRPAAPHPLLKRPMRARVRRFIRDGRRLQTTLFSRADLLAVREEVKRPMWLTRHEAVNDYGVNGSTLESYRADRHTHWRDWRGNRRELKKSYPLLDGQPLRVQWFPVTTKTGRRPRVLHYWRAGVEKLAKGAPKLGDDHRIVMIAGKRFAPQAETTERLGVKPFQVFLWRKSCPHLEGGRGIRCEKVRLKLFRNGHGPKVWIYSEEDADTIKAALGQAERPGLMIRGVNDVPLIDGRPATRKLTPGERETLIFLAKRQAAGHQRTTSDDLVDGYHPSRARFLTILSRDQQFGRFVSLPGGEKGKGFSVLNVQLQ